MRPEVTAALGLVIVGLVKASAVLCLGIAAYRMARGRGSGQRHVWRASFVGLALLPFLEALLPASHVGSLDLSHRLLAAELGNARLHVPVATAVFAVWASGTFAGVTGVIAHQVQAHLLARRAAAATDARLLRILVRAQVATGSRARVSLKMSTALPSPAVLGWWKPIVLLPADSVRWGDDEVFGVLCHELHHLGQADLVANVGERLTAAALWPNPLIHIVRRRAAFDREVAADRAALDAGVSPECFAARMIAIAKEGRGKRPPSTVLPFGLDIGFEARLRALFALPEKRDCPPWRIAAVVAAFVVVLPLVAVYTPVTCIPGTTAARGNTTRC